MKFFANLSSLAQAGISHVVPSQHQLTCTLGELGCTLPLARFFLLSDV